MERIAEWLFDGEGQIIVGMIYIAVSIFSLICGVIFVLRGLGIVN